MGGVRVRATTSAGLPPRPAAQTLRGTFRPDGVVLLELLVDWGTSLGSAAVPAEDGERVREVLTNWALQPQPQRLPRTQRRRPRDEDYGLEAEVVSIHGRNARAVSPWANSPARFARHFGAASAWPPEELEEFLRTLSHDVSRYFRAQRRRAAERLADGAYLPVLDAHLARCRDLAEDPRGYRVIEHTLVPIVEDEQYLRIVEDVEARRLFRELEDEIGRLYNRCMTVDR